MRAEWTGSGARTSGSTARPRGATRPASGGAATTSTVRAGHLDACNHRSVGALCPRPGRYTQRGRLAEPKMLGGFATSTIDVGDTTIFIRRKGSGPPLLLLHGFPETHLMWHAVAPALAEHFTVVCADLRGYGSTGRPPSSADHAPYSKSAMALDMARMMERLGFSRFGVAGHDRGARVAYRLALDHPDSIGRLAVL